MTASPRIAVSVARGTALAAALGALAVALRLLAGADAGGGASATPTCAAPVEIEHDGVARIGCAGEASLDGCGALKPGDRVRIAGGTCEPAGRMRAAWRLTYGLPLDLNAASADELELLEGIGPKLAHAIVEHRRIHGPFRRVGELDRVRGIGPATVLLLLPYLVVDEPGGERPVWR